MPTNRIAHKAIGASCKVCNFGHQRQIVDLAFETKKIKSNPTLWLRSFWKDCKVNFALRRHAAGRCGAFETREIA